MYWHLDKSPISMFSSAPGSEAKLALPSEINFYFIIYLIYTPTFCSAGTQCSLRYSPPPCFLTMTLWGGLEEWQVTQNRRPLVSSQKSLQLMDLVSRPPSFVSGIVKWHPFEARLSLPLGVNYAKSQCLIFLKKILEECDFLLSFVSFGLLSFFHLHSPAFELSNRNACSELI